MRWLALGLAMAFPLCMAAQLLDRGQSEHSHPKTQREWTLTGMGEMDAHDGTELGFVTYTNRGGIGVTTISGTFDSDEQAVAEVNHRIKDAKKGIEHSFLQDESGKTVGERVVVVFLGKSPEPDVHAVLWTNGRDFYEVASRSLSLALEREKKLTKPKQ